MELCSEAGRKELDEEWKALRRGWYVGGEGFVGKLQAHLDGVMRGRRRESHSGEAKRAHDEAAAERERVGTGISGIGPQAAVGGVERERSGEGGAGLVASATNDGVAAVGERTLVHGPLHAGDTGGQPGGASARSEAKSDQAQAASVEKCGRRISNEMS